MEKQQLNYKSRKENIKKYTLSFFSEWYLRHQGKKDCKKNTIRMNASNNYFSPYINQEIQLCYAKIEEEKEILYRIRLDIKSLYERAQNKLAVKKYQRDRIEKYFFDGGIDTTLTLDRGEDSYVLSERVATYMAKNKQLESIVKSIELMNSQKRECKYIMDKETNITYSRCKRHYNILLSRISAYWRGVLSANGKSENIPPLFDISDSLLNIERRIEMIKEIGDIYE